MSRKHRICVIVVAAVLAVVAASCGKFSYGTSDMDETILYSAVTTSSTEPCRVMMTRLVNSRHYVWDIDGVPHKVRSGEYYAVAFRASDQYDISSLAKFGLDPSMSMQEVYAVLPQDGTDYGKMADFNPYSSFISPAEGTLEYDFKRVSVKDSSMVMVFTPVPLTQKLTFRVKVNLGEGVNVTSLRAAVSGVPSKVRIMSGMVRNDAEIPTHRIYVPMKNEGNPGVYEGTVEVLGLFPPVSPTHTSGPGIFQVEVKANVNEGGRRYDRVFYAGINLKKSIEDASLMEAADDRSGYRIRRNAAVIEVPAVLEVLSDSVVSGEGEGVEQWFENDADIEVEI